MESLWKSHNVCESDVHMHAQKLAYYVNKAQVGLVIGLVGELGSGKTTWASAFIEYLTGIVASSPSYELVHSYVLDWGRLYHIDCYRLHQAGDLSSLGLEDLDCSTTLLLVEWPGKVAGSLPAFDILIHMSYPSNGQQKNACKTSKTSTKFSSHVVVPQTRDMQMQAYTKRALAFAASMHSNEQGYEL